MIIYITDASGIAKVDDSFLKPSRFDTHSSILTVAYAPKESVEVRINYNKIEPSQEGRIPLKI